MMTLEQIRERNRKENAARPPPSRPPGIVWKGRDPRDRAADRRPDHQREHQRRAPHVHSFPTWQDAAAALLG